MDSFHTRHDLHIAWVGLPFAIVIGAGAWLGVPGMIIPMVFLFIAWLLFVSYFWFMWPQWKRWRFLAQVIATVLCLGCAYLFYFVFAVSMNIRFLDGAAYGNLGEQVTVAVEAINRGKPTSLTHWRAVLINRDGARSIGEPLTLHGDYVSIQSATGHKSYYALPECDLVFETTKALQTGDAVYGIAGFLFRDYPATALPGDIQVEIEATDMLGRTISSPLFALSQINGGIFPCREIAPPKSEADPGKKFDAQ